ncbi:MAG: MmcQ/YjbR family DNA-binding protein [Bacilli bacterium]|nr:MmcQ/YjbR family DNA-binding protein [Bacilli bacterium]
MRKLDKELELRKIDYNSLKKYGFIKDKNKYSFSKTILDNQFLVVIEVENGKMISKIIELAFNDEYLLVDVEDVVGEYVGGVRSEYEKVINDVINNCTYSDVFKNIQTKEVIDYINNKYGDQLEFLWESYPKTAICRNKLNNKWYILFVSITENKLGLNSDKETEIIDLMYQKDKILEFVDNKKIFGGYHMNKKSWITIKLDNSIDTKKIFELIDNSYNISISK